MYYVLYLTVEEAREKKTVRNSSGRENAFTAFTENKPCVSGLAQFKPVSFKGQWYLFVFKYLKVSFLLKLLFIYF